MATFASLSPSWPWNSTSTISAEHFRLLNKCLDEAIASAVTEFARKQFGGYAQSAPPPPGFRLRNLSAAALLAFEAIKSGQVGVAGSTGTALHRHLVEILALAEQSVIEALSP